MRVLVTGGAGFLGRHLGHALMYAGHEPILAGHDAEWPVDFRAAELVFELFAESMPDAVVHLASTTGPVPSGPAELQSENVVHPLWNVLDAAGNRPVILVSDAAVYGSAPPDEAGPIAPRALYAASRASAEALARRRVQKTGQSLRIVRPFFLLGPDVPPRARLAQWLRPDPTPLTCPPLASLVDVLDVRDAADALVTLLHHPAAAGTFNLSAGNLLSYGELLAALAPGRLLEPSQSPPSRPFSGRASGLLALGWAPRFSVAETLAQTNLGTSRHPSTRDRRGILGPGGHG